MMVGIPERSEAIMPRHAAARWHGRRRRALGWTLVEMILVVMIMGTLLGIAMPKVQEHRDDARVAAAIGDIEAIQADLSGHEFLDGRLPATLAEIGWGDHLDPWGNPYRYLRFEGGGGGFRKDRFLVPINSTYDLYSMGSDGKSQPPLTASSSQDDVIRANDGAYIGLAANY